MDESLLHLVDSLDWDFEHVIVVSHSDPTSGALTGYEAVDYVVRSR